MHKGLVATRHGRDSGSLHLYLTPAKLLVVTSGIRKVVTRDCPHHPTSLSRQGDAMAIKSTAKVSPKKRPKPSRDWPFFWHASGTWAKKVRGRLIYFGTDDHAAKQLWETQREDLLNGKKLRRDTISSNGANDTSTVKGLANAYLGHQNAKVAAGEIGQRHFEDCLKSCERAARVLGRATIVDALTPDDFARLKADITRTHGHTSTVTEISRIRSMFNFGVKKRWIQSPYYGSSFDRPNATEIRLERANKPARDATRDEALELIEAAINPLRAMILLGLNCGFSNVDCGRLEWPMIQGNQVKFPRPKTRIDRCAFLWPESIEALDAWRPARPSPKSNDDHDLVFITKYGKPFHRESHTSNSIAQEFRKLRQTLACDRPGLTFLNLRHTFKTIACETGDQIAVNHVMGHVDGTMAGTYGEPISDERMRRVCNHVRQWLVGEVT